MDNVAQARDARRKYLNQTQLGQGVSQCYDPRLTQSERLYLMCLAVHDGKTGSHPGNQKLMRACGVTSRQALDRIRDKLLDKRLIEIVGNAKGGRGLAVVFRIR